MAMDKAPVYRAFILRMWVEADELQASPEPVWRFSLELIGAGSEPAAQRRGFASVSGLAAYLSQLTGQPAPSLQEQPENQ